MRSAFSFNRLSFQFKKGLAYSSENMNDCYWSNKSITSEAAAVKVHVTFDQYKINRTHLVDCGGDKLLLIVGLVRRWKFFV